MVASHDQVVEAHELLHDLAVAAADHAHGDSFGQPPHCLTHAGRDHGVLWTVTDRSQGPVVVEEHSRLLADEAPSQRLTLAERVREVTDLSRHSCSPAFLSHQGRRHWLRAFTATSIEGTTRSATASSSLACPFSL